MSDQNQNTSSTSSPLRNSGGQTGQASFTPLPDEQSGGKVALAKIATRQIAISRTDIEKFGIPEDFIQKNPVLIDLILKTESMKDEERKYWFQLLPMMSEDQVKKLQNILQNEKDQLAELDQKYAAEVEKLNQQKSNWDPEAFKKKKEEIRKKEADEEVGEANEEADILNQLENL